MLSFDGEVKVVDFGIAKAETQEESTKAGTLKGKIRLHVTRESFR